jgi:membrane protease YdiL (CAAX protease family)
MLTARPRAVQATGPDPRGGERAPGGPTPHNGTAMGTAGSVSPRPLSLPIAVAVTVLGVLAMLGSAWLTPRLGLALGVRGQIAFGTILLAVPALGALAARASSWKAVLGPGVVTRRTALLSLLLGAALWVGSVGLLEVQSLVRPPTPEELDLFRRIHAALRPAGPADLLLSLLVIAVLPALCEELVFRGVLLTSLAAWRGSGLAVVLSAAAFGLVHFDPVRPLFALVLGLALGLLRVRTASLRPSAVVHAFFNAVTFVVAPLVDDPSQPYTPQPALGLACLAAGVAGVVPLLRALARERGSSA